MYVKSVVKFRGANTCCVRHRCDFHSSGCCCNQIWNLYQLCF